MGGAGALKGSDTPAAIPIAYRDTYLDREPRTRDFTDAALALEHFGAEILGTTKERNGEGWIIRTTFQPARCESCEKAAAVGRFGYDGVEFLVCKGCAP